MNASNLRIGIYGDIQSEIVHRTVAGVIRYCDETGGITIRDFRLTSLPVDLADEPQLWKGKVDGVVISVGRGKASSEAMADWVVAGGVPAVNTTSDWLDPRVPSFIADRPSLAQLAAKHLVECGCASFLFFGYSASSGSEGRATAFRKALTEHRQKVSECSTSHFYFGSFEDRNAAQKESDLLEALRSMRKPIGVWALSDRFAHCVCMACEHLGLSIPDDVRVLGVDDLALARLCHPQLSSIRTPSEEVGYRAMRTLHRMIHGKRVANAITEIPAKELIARESTIGARQNAGNLDDVKSYIDRNACSGITVDQVVDVVGISRRAFEEWFREKVGHSPGQEILRVRLERAKHLLRNTDLSMTRICSMVGYKEASAFTRFFKSQTGSSPKEFRESAGIRAAG